MAGWLRKPKKDGEPSVSRSEIEALLPASTRHPEANRFTPIGSDMPEDGPDDDLEFFNTLVHEVERETQEPAVPARVRPTPTLQRVVPKDDGLQLFREMSEEGRRDAVVRLNIEVADVEISDLLEDLSTIRAALRRRKAA
jgi:hypothetical protein